MPGLLGTLALLLPLACAQLDLSFVDIHLDPTSNWVVHSPVSAAVAPEICRLASPHGMQLVRGTSVALVADTDSNSIQMVDLGFSQDAATIYVPLTSMPYAVRLDHEQRHLLVVNMRNGTLTRVDLFRNTTTLLASGLGKPTDVVVHPPTGRIILADAENHTLWSIDPLSGAKTWLCGANDPAEGYYAEGEAAHALFWVPLGLAYDDRRDVLYVADFLNRVIREVDPYNGTTRLRVGNHSKSPGIVDGDADMAILTGPTNLRYADGLLYFTDRNPNYNTGLVRVWDTEEGQVWTLAGQQQRSHADGNATTAGVDAAWGVDVSDAGWVVWTEARPNRTAVRVSARMPNGTMQATIPCQNGYYYSTSQGACMNCTNAKPHGTVFLTQGGIDEPESCRWRCPLGASYLPFTCPEGQALRSLSSFDLRYLDMAVDAVGGRPQSQVVVCRPGTQLAADGLRCTACEPGYFCDGQNSNGNGTQRCLYGSLSPRWSETQGDCFGCPANFYCTSGEAYQCPDNMVSFPDSWTKDSCTCMLGYYEPTRFECVQCPAGSYCPPGSSSPVSCPATTSSPAGSSGLAACVCPIGYYQTVTGMCCLDNTVLLNGQCKCMRPYRMVDGRCRTSF